MSALLDKPLILVAGKGGVGRSTAAAAIASACARRGRRTLLFEANAKDRYGELFGIEPVGPDMVRVGANLHAVNTNPAAALEEYGLMILRFKRIYRMVFENRVTRYFLRAIPGLDDYAVLGKAWYHTTERYGTRPRFDTVVFDLPASGHSLSMLRLPKIITETVPEGPLTRDARKIRSLLSDTTRTALILVTLAEEMPANEADELATALASELAISLSHLIINQVYPDRFSSQPPSSNVLDRLLAGPGADPDVDAVAHHAALMRTRHELNRRYLDQLEDRIPGPRTQLPRLFVPTVGPSEIEYLSQQLEAALG